MAVSNRTATTANSATAAATSLVLNAPTGTSAGDFLITTLTLNGGSGITVTPPSGWNLLVRTNSTTVLGQAIYYKIATASEPSTYTWSVTSCFLSGVCNGYTGVDNANPIAGFTALAKTTASTSATFGATIPQCETAYGVLAISGRNTTASTTLTTAGSYTIDGQTCTTGTNFMVTCQADQHATYNLPLVSVTPTSLTFSTTSTDIDTVIFLRPSLLGSKILQTDVATFATTLTSPITSLAFGTGYANEYVFVFVMTDGAATLAETTTCTGTTLTYTLVGRANSTTTGTSCTGTVDVYVAKAATPLAFNTEKVTVTPSTASSVVNVAIYSFINCAGAGTFTVGGSTAGATPSQSLTTTASGSWVWAALFNTNNATAPTLGSNQTLVEDYLPSGEGFWNWRETATTPAAKTAVTLNVTAPTAIEYVMNMVEILFANPIGKDIGNLNNNFGANIAQAINRSGNF